jgi:hypothetical protein
MVNNCNFFDIFLAKVITQLLEFLTSLKNAQKQFELCYENPPNVVQPCIFIKIQSFVDNPFQHYETEPPNQLHDKN